MNNQFREKLERNIALQFLVARQPDNAHPAAAQRLFEGVATEEFLATRKLAQRRVQSTPGNLLTHWLAMLATRKERVKGKLRSRG